MHFHGSSHISKNIYGSKRTRGEPLNAGGFVRDSCCTAHKFVHVPNSRSSASHHMYLVSLDRQAYLQAASAAELQLEVHANLWISIDSHGLQLKFHGFQVLPMEIYGIQWISNGIIWKSMSYEFKWAWVPLTRKTKTSWAFFYRCWSDFFGVPKTWKIRCGKTWNKRCGENVTTTFTKQ